MLDDAAPLAPESDRRAVAFAALVLAAVGMGASTIFVRLADVGPQSSAFWRMALALPFLYAWMRAEEHGAHPFARTRPSRREWVAVALSGLFFAGDLFFWHLAILNTTIANATFLATTAPVLIIVGAWILYREPVTAGVVAGLGLCLAGGSTLLGSTYAYAPERLFGDLCGLATATFFGAYFLAVRDARRTVGTARLSFLSALVTSLVLLAVALGMGDSLPPRSAEGLLVLLCLALVSQVGGQGLLAFSLGHLPAGFSSLVIFFEAVAAAALGWLVLGEALGSAQVAGGCLILAGIAVARPRRARR